MIPTRFIESVIEIGVDVDRDGLPKMTGSGFIYADQVTRSLAAETPFFSFFVTNKHVLEEVLNHKLKELCVRFNPRLEQYALAVTVPLVDKEGRQLWLANPDPTVDVAVVHYRLSQLPDPDLRVHICRGGIDLMNLRQMKENKIAEGHSVFVLGFPYSTKVPIHDRKYPVVRGGVIARIADTYGGDSPTYLVDATMFPGNSGGPVILQGERSSSPEGTSVIGIVGRYLYYEDDLRSDQTGDIRMRMRENSGLAVVQTVDAIADTVSQLKTKLGLGTTKSQL